MENLSNIPLIFNIFKPAGITSYDVIRHFKRNLPRPLTKKIGHIGTLDPFASGVLMVGINGGTKINDYVHQYMPKTYIAVGKLGVFTQTGDLTEKIEKTDESEYLYKNIAKFDLPFLQNQIEKKFLGTYMQAPHKYSAAKFEGRPLHQWAREGIEIKKEEVPRTIYKISVMKYAFPFLAIRVTVSSGTYIRTLFQDIAKYLGTFGTLRALVRESVGEISITSSLKQKNWPLKNENYDLSCNALSLDKVLPLNEITLLDEHSANRYRNGVSFYLKDIKVSKKSLAKIDNNYWVFDHDKKLIGMGKTESGKEVRPCFNFAIN